MKDDIEIASTQAFVRLRRLKNKGDIKPGFGITTKCKALVKIAGFY
jgi:hypothetical protein